MCRPTRVAATKAVLAIAALREFLQQVIEQFLTVTGNTSSQAGNEFVHARTAAGADG